MFPLLTALFLTTSFVNTSSAEVRNVVRAETSGGNVSVKTEIISTVNGETTRVESNQPGEIKVRVEDGKVDIQSDSAKPTITIYSVVTPVVEEQNNKIDGGAGMDNKNYENWREKFSKKFLPWLEKLRKYYWYLTARENLI